MDRLTCSLLAATDLWYAEVVEMETPEVLVEERYTTRFTSRWRGGC
jgi:hypothetical protein